MRQVHLARDKLFVDYSGKKAHIIDPDTGEVIDVELFVAVSGASNYAYAEATATKREARTGLRVTCEPWSTLAAPRCAGLRSTEERRQPRLPLRA